MKNIFSIIVIISLFFCLTEAFAQKMRSDLEKQGIKGKVLRIDQSTYKAHLKFGDYAKGKKISSHHEYFNELGNTTKLEYFDSLDIPSGNTIYVYDNKELLTVSTRNSSKYGESKIYYKHEISENITLEIRYKDKEKTKKQNSTKYDYNKYRIEDDDYNFDGKLTGRWISLLDRNLQMIKKSRYDSNGDAIISSSFKNDIHGNIVQSNLLIDTWDCCDYDISYYEYVYDKKGNWIVKVSINGNKLVDYIERTYQYGKK